MVLSHSKLKRKRREERAANGEAVVPDPETTAATVAPICTPESSVVATDTTKKKKEKKKKKRKADASGETELPPGGSPTEPLASDGVQELKKFKKEKKKRQANSNVLDKEVAGVVQLANSLENAVSNGLDETEPVGPDDHGATPGEVQEPSMTVREKKGKKKNSGRDRWGEKIAEEPEAKENSFDIEAVNRARPQSDASSGDIYDPRKVFVGGIPYYATEDDIHDYFSECGVISVLDGMTFEDSGNFCGIAFITFTTDAAATKSLDYNGAYMGDRFLKIERCKVKPQAAKQDTERGEVQKTPGSTSAYIGNLSWDIDEESIKKFLKKSYSNCKIESIRLSFDKVTGEFKGFGHIDFGDDESLEAAVKLNQTPLLGRPLKIAYAVPPRQKYGGDMNYESNTRRVGTCYICGQEGHKAFLCPNKGASGDQKPDVVKIASCYSCGEEGHKSFMCPQKNVA